MTAIALRDLRFTYPARRRQPARHALCGITLDIPPGQSVALLGPNGSGKSTLIRVVTGMAQATAGEASVFDRPPHAARDLLGVVFQNAGLDRHMTVWENLRDSATLYGLAPAEARSPIDALLRDMRLDDRRHALVKTLSGGLTRRVDLCRALLSRPRVLILDEPTTGLDPVARREFLDQVELRRGNGDELTVVMSTHLTDEAERTDRVIMLHDGVIVADDAPAALRRQLGARRVTVHDPAWQPAEQADRWHHAPGAWSRDLPGDSEATAIASSLAQQGVPFSIAPPTLDDVFEQLTGTRLIGDAPDEPSAKEAA